MKKLIKKILKLFLLKSVEKIIEIQDKKVKSKIELASEWLEELLLSTDIELENVFVHNLGNWGVCGKNPYGYTLKTLNDGTQRKFKIPHSDKAYMFLPEIKDVWTIHAWIHEIGHYMLKHSEQRDKPTYIKEYEAEQFSIDNAKKCPHINNMMMIEIEVDARWYVFNCLLNDIKNGKTTKNTMDETVKSYLLESKYIAEEFDTKCAMAEYEYNHMITKKYESIFG